MNSAEHYTTRYLETDDLDQYIRITVLPEESILWGMLLLPIVL